MLKCGRMEKEKILAIFALSAAIIASGCISDDEEEIPEGDVTVAVGEMYFQQEDSNLPENTLEAEINEEIVFHNEGSIAHTVTIEEYDIDERLESGETMTITAKEEVEDTLVDCTLHENHEAELTVT